MSHPAGLTLEAHVLAAASLKAGDERRLDLGVRTPQLWDAPPDEPRLQKSLTWLWIPVEIVQTQQGFSRTSSSIHEGFASILGGNRQNGYKVSERHLNELMSESANTTPSLPFTFCLSSLSCRASRFFFISPLNSINLKIWCVSSLSLTPRVFSHFSLSKSAHKKSGRFAFRCTKEQIAPAPNKTMVASQSLQMA